jgi:hypothetical protein
MKLQIDGEFIAWPNSKTSIYIGGIDSKNVKLISSIETLDFTDEIQHF